MIFNSIREINESFIKTLGKVLVPHPIYGASKDSNAVKVYNLYEASPMSFPSIGVNTDFSGPIYSASFENRDFTGERVEGDNHIKQYSWQTSLLSVLHFESLSLFELDQLVDYIACIFISKEFKSLNPYGAIITEISASTLSVGEYGNKNKFSRDLTFSIIGHYTYDDKEVLQYLEKIDMSSGSYYKNIKGNEQDSLIVGETNG